MYDVCVCEGFLFITYRYDFRCCCSDDVSAAGGWIRRALAVAAAAGGTLELGRILRRKSPTRGLLPTRLARCGTDRVRNVGCGFRGGVEFVEGGFQASSLVDTIPTVQARPE